MQVIGLSFVFLVSMFDLMTVFLVQMFALFALIVLISRIIVIFAPSVLLICPISVLKIFLQIPIALKIVPFIWLSLLFVVLILLLVVFHVPMTEQRIAMIVSLISLFHLLVVFLLLWTEQRIAMFVSLILITLLPIVLPSFWIAQRIVMIVSLIWIILRAVFPVFLELDNCSCSCFSNSVSLSDGCVPCSDVCTEDCLKSKKS